jgi:small-conductance mechanosensitive channel
MRLIHRSTRRLCVKWFVAFALTIPAAIVICWGVAGGADQPLTSDAVIRHLSAVTSWYRDSTAKVQPVGLASDAMYQGNAQNLATQAVRLAFDASKAAVPLVPNHDQSAGTNGQPSQGSGQSQNLVEFRARTKAHLADLQAQLDPVNKQLASAPARARKNLMARRDTLQGEIDLNNAILDSVAKMLNFMEGGNDSSSEGLLGNINQLAHSVPEIFGAPGDQKSQAKPAAPAVNQAPASNSSGLIGQATLLYGQMRTIHEIDQLADETEGVRNTADALRQPLREAIRATIQQSNDLEKQAQAPGANPSQAENIKKQFEDLTARFKILSAALIPLSQEIVVLDESRSNLLEWRRAISEHSGYALRSLLFHVGTIAIALGLLLVLSEVWRRATFRYVHDTRRRRQFLTMRRFVVGFLMGIVIILGFVSEFSSLATFAGFVTAGIAVGLQAVLLSIAAYFFLIGRYGIRVGERVNVAGVTGDVVDIGLVRLYLMELAISGADYYPTGRVVVFSNAVFFQAGIPFYKQLPGTEYTWHEVSIALGPTTHYKEIQEKLLNAVNSVYATYREDIERQHAEVERRIDIFMKAPVPEAQLRFTDAGLEFRVRYPVALRQASTIDDEVTRKVLEVVNNDPELNATTDGKPKIRAANA